MTVLDSRASSDTRLQRASEMKPLVTLDLANAQPSCNFVVFAPTALPAGCVISSTTLRPELPPGRPEGMDVAHFGQTPWSAANPCSLRTVIGGGGRAIRVKQFLYDWAPSAAGIASLWDSPAVTPFECQGAIGWLGTDYHQMPGGCVSLSRTTIEVCVVGGAFEDAELEGLMRGMTVADPRTSREIDATPFHVLNYWVHYRIPPYRVPYGLSKYPHKRLYDRSTRVTQDELAGLARTRPLLPASDDAVIDSLLHLEDTAIGHHEVEVIARRPGDPNGTIWMTGMSRDSERAMALPPEREARGGAEVRAEVTARGTTIWIAALTEQFGTWEAVWEEANARYAVWFGTSSHWNRQRVLDFVERLTLA